MQLAMIGLGRMGGNMTERLMRGGHTVVAFDREPDTVAKYQQMGATPAKDLADVVQQALRAARHLDHGAGRQAGGRHDRRASCRSLRRATSSSTAATRITRTRCARAERLAAQADQLHRRRHQRRHLGAGERLLPDGRRRHEAR